MFEIIYDSGMYPPVKLDKFKIKSYVYNGSLGIESFFIEDEEIGYEPFGFITVCLEGMCQPFCAFIDTNNLPGIEETLKKYKIAEPTGRVQRSGYCIYPEYRFNKDVLKKMDRSGYAEYINVLTSWGML